MSKVEGTEVAKHNSRQSCWIAVHGKVYDVTGKPNGTPQESKVIDERVSKSSWTITQVEPTPFSEVQARMQQRNMTVFTVLT